MITRIRIDAMGESAAEVEAHFRAITRLLNAIGLEVHEGEQHIERDSIENPGYTAHKGRLLLHPNTATDAAQVRLLKNDAGGCSTLTHDFAGNPTEIGRQLTAETEGPGGSTFNLQFSPGGYVGGAGGYLGGSAGVSG